MKTRGRRHSPGEELLLRQVREEFSKKKDELGARQAAEQMKVCLASFYKYVAGTDLPRMEVLREAQQRWGIKWELIDPSEILRTRRISSGEQLALAFLEAVRQQDVEIAKIGPKGKSILQITLQIRFPA